MPEELEEEEVTFIEHFRELARYVRKHKLVTNQEIEQHFKWHKTERQLLAHMLATFPTFKLTDKGICYIPS